MATGRRTRGDLEYYPNDDAIMASDHILSFIRDNNVNEFFIPSITILEQFFLYDSMSNYIRLGFFCCNL